MCRSGMQCNVWQCEGVPATGGLKQTAAPCSSHVSCMRHHSNSPPIQSRCFSAVQLHSVCRGAARNQAQENSKVPSFHLYRCRCGDLTDVCGLHLLRCQSASPSPFVSIQNRVRDSTVRALHDYVRRNSPSHLQIFSESQNSIFAR
jgi:hypothetical protein